MPIRSGRTKHRPRAAWRRVVSTRRGREEGAVLVEAALVIPILLLLIFGIIEFGFIFKDTLTLSSMTRAGVRTGAVVGDSASPDADYQVLMAVRAADGALSSGIQEVIVYKAAAADDSVPSACMTPESPTQTSPNGVAGECNIYSGAELKALAADWTTESQTGNFGGASSLDQFWAPTTRVVSEAIGPDYIGVYISALHNNVTVWFHTITLHDQAVMRLEPQTL